MTQKVEFFFDIVSPYTYIASTQIEALVQRCEAELIWRPFLLGGVFKMTGNQPPAALRPRGQFLLKDLMRHADYYNISLKMPKQFPTNSLLAMRVLTGLPENEIPAAAHKLFTLYWIEGQDIGDEQVVLDAMGESAIAKASMPEIKEQLKETTAKAVERGAFGAPTFFVDNEIFFGQDRLFLLEKFLTQ